MNFTVWNKKNCKIHTIRTRKLFLKDGNRYLVRVRNLTKLLYRLIPQIQYMGVCQIRTCQQASYGGKYGWLCYMPVLCH